MKSINVHLSVHKDITERLPKINPALAKDTKDILLENKKERHIRGGIATREKYKNQGRKCVGA